MSRIADDLCAEVRHQCEQAEHFKGLWMQANDELERARAAERTWETTMMKAIGEDGPRSVSEAIAKLEKQRDDLLAALEKMNRAYVNLIENGRDRIVQLGGDCDPVDVMERDDPHLRESRTAIASVKGGA